MFSRIKRLPFRHQRLHFGFVQVDTKTNRQDTLCVPRTVAWWRITYLILTQKSLFQIPTFESELEVRYIQVSVQERFWVVGFVSRFWFHRNFQLSEHAQILVCLSVHMKFTLNHVAMGLQCSTMKSFTFFSVRTYIVHAGTCRPIGWAFVYTFISFFSQLFFRHTYTFAMRHSFNPAVLIFHLSRDGRTSVHSDGRESFELFTKDETSNDFTSESWMSGLLPLCWKQLLPVWSFPQRPCTG